MTEFSSPAPERVTQGDERYRGFVDPSHPLIAELFRPGNASPLETALEDLRRHALYESAPGWHSFDELRIRREERAGKALSINCMASAALLVSQLRRAALPADRVWVALAGRRGAGAFHAWTLLLDEARGAPWWIDPVDLAPRRLPGERILAGHTLHVLFNDQAVALAPAAKRAIVLERR